MLLQSSPPHRGNPCAEVFSLRVPYFEEGYDSRVSVRQVKPCKVSDTLPPELRLVLVLGQREGHISCCSRDFTLLR